MASTKKDNIQLGIEINGQKAGATLQDIKKEVRLLKTELDKLPVGTDEFKRKLEELRGKEAVLSDLGVGAKKTKDTMEGILPVLKPMQGGIDMVSGSFGGLMKALGPIMIIFTALKGAFDFLSGAVEKFDDAEKSANQLKAAFKGNEAAVNDLIKVSKELEAVTLTDDNELQKQMARMKGFSMTADEIKKLTPLMQDWAAFMDKDMQGAVDDLGAAIEGTAGPFEDLGIRFDESTPKAEKLAIIQKVLGERIEGTARVAAQSGTGGWTILKNQFGELMERIGGLVVRFGNALLPAIQGAVSVVSWAIGKIESLYNILGKVGDAISSVYTSVKGFFVGVKPSLDEMANNYRKMSGDAKIAYESIAAAQGINVNQMKAKAKELTIAEGIELKKRYKQAIDTYNEMSAEQQKILENTYMAMAMGNPEAQKALKAQIEKFRTDAAKTKAEEKAKADAEWYANHKDEIDRKREEAKAKLDELRATEFAIRKLRAELIQDETTQKIVLRKIQFEEDIAAIKGDAAQKLEQEKLLTAVAHKEIAELQKQFNEEILKKQKDFIKAYYDSVAETDREELDAEIKRREEAEREKMLNKNKKLKDVEYEEKSKLFVLETSFVNELELIRGNEEEKMRIEKEYALKKLAIQEDAVRQKLNLLQSSGNAEREQVLALQQQLLEIQKQRISTEQATHKDNYEKKIDTTKKTGLSELEVIKHTQNAIQDITQLGIDLLGRDEESKKRHAKTIQAIQRGQIVAASVAEIASIWKNNAANPMNAVIPGWGIAISIVQTAAAVARAAVGLAKVDSIKYAKGARLGGQLHSEGGNPIIDGKTGEVIAEVEAGEVILSKETVKNNPTIVDALLHSSMNRNGAPIFAMGGMFDNIPTIPTYTDKTAQVIQIMFPPSLKAVMEHSDYTKIGKELSFIKDSASL